MNDKDLIMQSLERMAEKAGDFTPDVYENYFQACEESRELMSHVDPRVKGKMLEEVVVLLTGTDPDADRNYLKFEVNTHRGYGVTPYMYRNLLDSVSKTVRDTLDDEWTGEIEAAWRRQIDWLLGQIEPIARGETLA